jgi:hypothetical protein
MNATTARRPPTRRGADPNGGCPQGLYLSPIAAQSDLYLAAQMSDSL